MRDYQSRTSIAEPVQHPDAWISSAINSLRLTDLLRQLQYRQTVAIPDASIAIDSDVFI